MALFNVHIAWFFNSRGEYDGSKRFKPSKDNFKYGDGSYNIDIKNGSDVENMIIPLLLKKKRFFYNVNYSNPLNLKQFTKEELQTAIAQSNKNNKNDDFIVPPITPELYNINLETKVARDLNDLAKGNLFNFIKEHPAVIFIGIIGLVALWYFGSGHTLNGLFGSQKPAQSLIPLLPLSLFRRKKK